MRWHALALALALVALVPGESRPDAPPPLQQSHAWIVVATGAPERAKLEEAGFRIAPTTNRHDGQGTASISIELLDGYLELIYPDPTVPVSPERQAGAEKFRQKSAWRTSGYCPIGIVFDRTNATPATFPFPTWRVSADWMEPGTSIEMLTPREIPKALSLSISPHARTAREVNEELAKDPERNAMFHHPNGARRLTRLRVIAPAGEDALPPSASWVSAQGLLDIAPGPAWLLDVTLDRGAQGRTADLRPDLPLVIHY